jgi:hypothetical protein
MGKGQGGLAKDGPEASPRSVEKPDNLGLFLILISEEKSRLSTDILLLFFLGGWRGGDVKT